MTNKPYIVDAELTGIALAYVNPTGIADKALKKTPVTSTTFKWNYYPEEQFITIPKTLTGRKGQANEVDLKYEERTASTEINSLKVKIPYADLKDKPTQDLERTNTIYLSSLMALAREVRVAKMLQTASNFGSNTRTLTSAQKFSAEGVDAFETIAEIIDGMLIKPNKMIMNRYVYGKLRRNASVVAASSASGKEKGSITKEDLQDLFEIPEILVGESYINSAKPGKTAQIESAWGANDITFIYDNPIATPELGLTFGLTAEYENLQIATFDDLDAGSHGVKIIRAVEQTKELVLAPNCGYLLKGVY